LKIRFSRLPEPKEKNEDACRFRLFQVTPTPLTAHFLGIKKSSSLGKRNVEIFALGLWNRVEYLLSAKFNLIF